MNAAGRHPLISATRINSLGTLASRVLGMLRDVAMAALLGMSGGGVMDAFVTAFRIPNTFRRLFGEGALAASYLPVLAAQLESDRRRAWQLVSVLLTWLAMLLAALTLAGEALCGLAYLAWGHTPGMSLLLGLLAVMFPYMLLICLAAQVAATLQALGHFSLPALAPAVLNICWLAAACLVAPWFHDRQTQAYVVAAAVLAAGGLQLASQWVMLPRLGFRFDYNWPASRAALLQVGRAMLPMTLGLAVTQVNTLCDSLMAWGLAAAPGGSVTMSPLGSATMGSIGSAAIRYPLSAGAAAAIYYGERLYEFPTAILGMAVAVAIYPLLSRHAARGDRQGLGADLTLGLRLVLFLSVPAAIGLGLLAQPLARLLLEHGHFTAADTLRAGRVVGCFALGVWAYCALPVLVRGFYALGDRRTPVRAGMALVGLNLVLDLTLVWPLGEAGLALSTAVCAVLQVSWLLLSIARRQVAIDWPALRATAWRTVAASAAMALAGRLALVAAAGWAGFAGRLAQVALPLAVCLAVYLAVHRLLRGPEVGMMLSGAVPA